MGSSSFQTYGSSVAKSKIISPHFAPRNYDVSGQSTDGYQVYTFTSTTKNYQSISYNLKEPKTLSIMVVGGGGNGGLKFAGGGGGGGFLQKTIILPIGNDTININIGNANFTIDRVGAGESTYVSFDNNQALNLIAGGGGNGSIYQYNGANGSINGGSGGGGSLHTTNGKGIANNSNGNLANNGGNGEYEYNRSETDGSNAGGGGGSSTIGQNASRYVNGAPANGGDGIKCTLDGIRTFQNYGNYYWASGGGGLSANTKDGNGGLGGGGGGGSGDGEPAGPRRVSTVYGNGVGDTNSLNPASDGTFTNGGNAGVNTGGGGGGGARSNGGYGGSGPIAIK
jgi:hypothetical protein